MAHGSRLAVGAAIAGNSVVMVAKFVVFGFTGSAAMLSESLHSVADVLNQILLMVGIVRANRKADRRFQFGYGAERAIWALMSAVGIFFLGAGVTIYHGVTRLLHPHELEELGLAIAVLVASFFIEAFVLYIALKAAKRGARGASLWAYLRRDAEPGTVAVILEDGAACTGILIALAGIVLTRVTGQLYWDAVASITIGVLLGAVAAWLIARNHELLMGPAIPVEVQERIQRIVTANPAVHKIVRLRTRMLDTETYRVAADVEFSGDALAAKLEDKLRAAYPGIESYDDFRAFAADFAEEVVEKLGDEVDAIEDEIQRTVPKARYLDIEAE